MDDVTKEILQGCAGGFNADHTTRRCKLGKANCVETYVGTNIDDHAVAFDEPGTLVKFLPFKIPGYDETVSNIRRGVEMKPVAANSSRGAHTKWPQQLPQSLHGMG